nr:NAD(P)-dependent oxidoreductase [uncultured Paracoccus sp.]
MVRRHWSRYPPDAELVYQSRRDKSDLLWDPLTSPLPSEAGQFSCLIAFAGITPATGSRLELNVTLAEATLAAARAANIPRVLLTSSSAVYGAPLAHAPLRETDLPHPLNTYGKTKAAMEEVCVWWRADGLEVCCLRIGNVAGADALLLSGDRATHQDPLHIDQFADGDGPRRSYIGPSTLAKVMEALANTQSALPDVLNIAAPHPVGMRDLAVAAGFPWTWVRAPQSAVQDITLNCTALSRLYEFSPADSCPDEMVRQWKCQDIQP